jgi:multidrug resistance efflux pump
MLTVLHRSAGVAVGEVSAARGEVEALAAELNTCVDDLRDEVDLLKVQLEIRKADLAGAQAQLGKTTEIHKYQEKLAKDKVISQNEIGQSQKDVDIRSADVAKKQAELNEVVLRIKQATRRRDEAIKLTDQAKGLVPEQDAAPRRAAPATKP